MKHRVLGAFAPPLLFRVPWDVFGFRPNGDFAGVTFLSFAPTGVKEEGACNLTF